MAHASLSRCARKAALASLAALSVPMIAMLFTHEIRWGIEDFVAAAALLFAAAMAYAVAVRQAQSAVQRFAVAALVGVTLLATWAYLAVGHEYLAARPQLIGL